MQHVLHESGETACMRPLPLRRLGGPTRPADGVSSSCLAVHDRHGLRTTHARGLRDTARLTSGVAALIPPAWVRVCSKFTNSKAAPFFHASCTRTASTAPSPEPLLSGGLQFMKPIRRKSHARREDTRDDHGSSGDGSSPTERRAAAV